MGYGTKITPITGKMKMSTMPAGKPMTGEELLRAPKQKPSTVPAMRPTSKRNLKQPGSPFNPGSLL